MDAEELQKLTRQAKEAVADLEEPFKTEGFKIVLNKLLEQKPSSRKATATIKARRFPSASSDDEVQSIISKLNRTEFQEINGLKTALDQALFILKIARDNAVVDGLLPLQISKILSLVFRIKTTSAAIGVALSNAGAYVDRKPVKVRGGTGYKYLLMQSGETHLTEVMGKGMDHE